MWVIVEMIWSYDDIGHVKVRGTFQSKDEAMRVMELLMNDRPPGTTYLVRPIEPLD